jgi:heptosyltransferase-3
MRLDLRRTAVGILDRVVRWASDPVTDSSEEIPLEGIQKVLVIRRDRLGDLLLATPAIRALRQGIPEAPLTVLASTTVADAIEGNPWVDRIVRMAPAGGIGFVTSYLKVARELRRQHFDLVFDFTYDFTFASALICRLARGIHSVGFCVRGREVYHDLAVEPKPGSRYEAERSFELLEAVGVERGDPIPVRPMIYPSVAHRKEVAEFLKNSGLDGTMLIGIHPGARRGPHRWPWDRFAELGRRLIDGRRRGILITWGRGEEKLARRVAKAIGGGAFPTPQTSPRLLAAFLERCCLFVTGDTGPMHVAVAVGTPVLCLSGRSDRARWGPPEEGVHRAIGGKRCREITVDEVLSVASDMVQYGGA